MTKKLQRKYLIIEDYFTSIKKIPCIIFAFFLHNVEKANFFNLNLHLMT